MKMAVFWDDAPCSLLEIDRRLKAVYCSSLNTPETSVSFYRIARRNIPEDKSSLYSSPWEPEISPIFIPFVCELIQSKVQSYYMGLYTLLCNKSAIYFAV
jgi:hypothetical protein